MKAVGDLAERAVQASISAPLVIAARHNGGIERERVTRVIRAVKEDNPSAPTRWTVTLIKLAN
jgi:hypothetical protein